MRITYCMWLSAALLVSATVPAQVQKISPDGQKCVECHGSTTPGFVAQWNSSAQAKAGVEVQVP
jgi:hypothetical protein